MTLGSSRFPTAISARTSLTRPGTPQEWSTRHRCSTRVHGAFLVPTRRAFVQGDAILMAGLDVALNKIKEVHGPSFSGLFVFCGGSAGGLGAILNSKSVRDFVQLQLPNARFRLISFSPVFFDLDEGTDALEQLHTSVIDTHGIELLDSCVFEAAPGEDDWKCWRTENAIREVPEDVPWCDLFTRTRANLPGVYHCAFA